MITGGSTVLPAAGRTFERLTDCPRQTCSTFRSMRSTLSDRLWDPDGVEGVQHLLKSLTEDSAYGTVCVGPG